MKKWLFKIPRKGQSNVLLYITLPLRALCKSESLYINFYFSTNMFINRFKSQFITAEGICLLCTCMQAFSIRTTFVWFGSSIVHYLSLFFPSPSGYGNHKLHIYSDASDDFMQCYINLTNNEGFCLPLIFSMLLVMMIIILLRLCLYIYIYKVIIKRLNLMTLRQSYCLKMYK